MAITHRAHWLAPATVVCSLSAGALFAFGHHLFYASLDGKAVQSNDLNFLGTRVSRQQVNITAGTVFSYLVNFFLGTAIATAYAQVFWRSLLRSQATLEAWDAAFSATSNVFFLGKLWIWWQFPLLFGVLVVAWLLPLASTIPPGTLSIGMAKIDPPPTVQRHVPNVDFTSLNYVANMQHVDSEEDSELETQYQYNGPSTEVQRIADQVSQIGALLPIVPPYPNASWVLDFYGPALKCSSVPDAMQSVVQQRLKSTISDGLCDLQGYITWSDDSSFKLPNNVSISFNGAGNEGLAINIAAFPHMLDLVPWQGGNGLTYIPYTKACYNDDGLDDPERFSGSTMIRCQLQNVTYHVAFDYANGNQSVEVTTRSIDDGPIQPIKFVRGLGTAYQNQVIRNDIDCSVLSGWTDGPNPNDYCRVDTQILETLSYQAIFDAFYSRISGSVSRGLADTSQNVSTNIGSTVLVETPELHFLTEPSETFSAVINMPLQEYLLAGNLPLFQGLVNKAHPLRSESLMVTIERLFQNTTLSMMSSGVLQPNLTSSFAPPQVEVTLKNIHNVYVYSSARLWISYGIAVFFAVIIAAVGIWTVFANGASYSQDFSTVFRVARGASMTEMVKTEDSDGRDPLPRYLKQSKVWLQPIEVFEKDGKKHSEKGGNDETSDNVVTTASPTAVEREAGHANSGT